MDYKLPKRIEVSNKGTFGKVLNVAGSKYMRGAAYLSSVSALKVGCGYVVLCAEDDVLNTVSNLLPEAVLSPLNCLEKNIEEADVISIGCGLSTDTTAKNIFKRTIETNHNCPMIIDADGLNILATTDNIKFKNDVILTPHPMEASRLLNVSLDDILDNMEKSATEISKKYNCVTVLKSHKTIVCSKDFQIHKNSTGNSALAKAGSGDILCGMISGFVAQKMDCFEAAKLGVYLHGLSGEIASKNLTEYGVLASDLVRFIPNAIFELIKH